MNMPAYRSFPAFELIVVGALVLVAWAAYKVDTITPAAEESRKDLAELRDDYSVLADSVQTNLDGLEFILTNSTKGKDWDKSLSQFHSLGREWIKWLDDKTKLWNGVSTSTTTAKALRPV